MAITTLPLCIITSDDDYRHAICDDMYTELMMTTCVYCYCNIDFDFHY